MTQAHTTRTAEPSDEHIEAAFETEIELAESSENRTRANLLRDARTEWRCKTLSKHAADVLLTATEREHIEGNDELVEFIETSY